MRIGYHPSAVSYHSKAKLWCPEETSTADVPVPEVETMQEIIGALIGMTLTIFVPLLVGPVVDKYLVGRELGAGVGFRAAPTLALSERTRMKKKTSKMTLSRETLRRLDPVQLKQADGGVIGGSAEDNPTNQSRCEVCPETWPITY